VLARPPNGAPVAQYERLVVTIAIVDYHAGNLASVKKAFDHLGADAVVTSQPEVIAAADKVVLPGVGHFAATVMLAELGLRPAIEQALGRGIPFLGICVGMQWMFEGSEEASGVPGLGLWAGQCKQFPATVKSPHVGWNTLQMRRASRLLSGVEDQSFVYFTHSFRAPIVDSTAAACEYAGPFSAVVERDNIFGVQFHPEKSGPAGQKLLENFCGL
jgi:glutamine amidotransferase